MKRSFGKSAECLLLGSNQRPLPYHGSALPTELNRQFVTTGGEDVATKNQREGGERQRRNKKVSLRTVTQNYEYFQENEK